MVWSFTVKGGPDSTVVGTAHPYGGYNTHATSDWGKWCEKWLKRRAIAIPLYTLIALVAFALSPVVLVLLYIADVIRIKRMARENEHVDYVRAPGSTYLTYTRTGLFFLSYLFAEMCGVWLFGLGDYLLHNALWLVQYPFYMNDPQQLHKLTEERWQRWVYTSQYWWGARVFCKQCFSALGLEYTLEGKEEIDTDRPYILLMRHSSTADVLMPQFMFSDNFRMRYVVKKEILWDVGLDVMGSRSPNLFLSRSARDADMEAELQSMKNLVADFTPASNIITSIWPEGTRFDTKKRNQVLAKLKENAEKERAKRESAPEDPVAGKGKEKQPDTLTAEEMYERAQTLQHTLLPRAGGVLAMLEENEAKGQADVLICGHVGLEQFSNFWDFASGKLGRVTVHVKLWRIRFADIPKDNVERTRWLFDNWKIVDDWLAETKARQPQHNNNKKTQ